MIYAKINVPFKITMSANYTTGYKWYIDTDDRYIKYIGEQSSINNLNLNLNLIGSPSTVNFVFLPIKPINLTHIIMKYKRPWENTIAKINIEDVYIQN